MNRCFREARTQRAMHGDAAADRPMNQIFERHPEADWRTLSIRSSSSSCLRDFVAAFQRVKNVRPVNVDTVERMSVRVDRHRAVAIGSEDLGAGVTIALQHVGGRVAEAVAAADADDGHARREGSHELRRARGQAAVVRHLDDAQRRQVESRTPATARPLSRCRRSAATETSRQRSSITIESSLRTRCRSQSAASGCRTITATSSIDDAVAGPDVRPSQPQTACVSARTARSGSNRGTGMPSQISRGRNSRTIDGAPPM